MAGNYDLDNKAKSEAVKSILKGIYDEKFRFYPLRVYDIYRCKITYDSIQDLNKALKEFSEKY